MSRYNSTMPEENDASAPRELADKAADGADTDRAISGSQPEPGPPEYGGRKKGLDPTRYGDWEKNGRCIDF